MEATKLVEIRMDGIPLVVGVHYTLTGNTTITYFTGYLNTLATGNYTIEIVFNNGFIGKGTLIIKDPAPVTPPSSGGGG